MSWSRIKHFLLLFLIALSLFLSFQIWTAGGQYRQPSSTRNTTVTTSLADRTMAEVFSADRIIWHRNAIGRTVGSNAFHMRDWLSTAIESMAFGEVETPERMTSDEYEEFISTGNWVEFLFDAPIPFGLFSESFDNLPTDYENRTFTRFYINTDDPLRLGFYDAISEVQYGVDDSNFTQDILYDLLYSPENEFRDVERFELGTTAIYLPVDEVEVEYHDYLVERLPNNLYINHFFEDRSEVDARRTGNTMRYIDLTTEVRINDATNTLTYLRQRADLGQMTFSDRLLGSYRELQLVENWTETIQYHDYLPESQEVIFQRHIQGYPVFSYQQLESTVSITVVESGLTNLTLPMRVVQTPITLSGSTIKTLPSGGDVIDMLAQTEQGLDSIQDIRLGLTWVESEEDERVVHFEPHWYVQTQGAWYEVNRYIELQEATINGL